MSALRRALGDGQGGNRYVITVPGRGYNFVAPVRREEPSRTSPPPTVASAVRHNLPFAVTRMIGRDDAVAAVVTRLSRERLVTIVGPGGIGKTTLALAVAERMMASYEHGVWLVDLAPREIDNLRAALDWALSPGGDGSVGVALTAAAGPLWRRLSLIEESRSRTKQALGALGAPVPEGPETRVRK